MLVLTRKAGQVLHIGEDIALTIIDIAGGSVRIGIDAPRYVQIVREEAKTDQYGMKREVDGNR